MMLPMNVAYPKHHAIKTGHIARCQICNSSKLHLILDLGFQPPADSLLSEKMLHEPEKTYPLRMMWCEKCTGVQLDYCVDGKEVYHPNYPYRSGITKPLAEYQRNISFSLIEKYGLNSKDLVIDIGSNDGTLLSGFKEKGVRVLGVEPTNTADIANKIGIKTIKSFFDIKTAKTIRKKYGTAAVMTATNVFAHMQTLGEVIMGIYTLLEDDGVFVSESHYLLDVIRDNQFDTVYHEHLRTYSLHSLIALFKQYDFTVTDVERGSRYGGNIRVHVTKGKGRKVGPAVGKLLAEEKKFGLHKLKTYTAFANRVRKARLELVDFLIQAKKKGKHIVGKSSPARAATLLNYYGIDTELIPYLAEQSTSLKLNQYLPGGHIPIVDEKILRTDKPDYIVLMAWHYAKEISKRLKAEGIKSDFVVPLPKVRILKNAEVEA
ncbi:methyltransferase [Candidatus Kaiserbacteria bacterium RIFCSPLOWO2_01_FULL_53_17]|uniref:Methyltransferase n=1 Tax=Candidatus Kaiserbacteria bacterium RIFCSPLOWO2_01_FULL_53_17 TaxID=1798511 RepID=A0A1F6EG47_9BACT|nr:MAG: methyltransferase [Candidatus Kaiserbacteria bacterium RIFCSPLOWO2_01_FULL_53_17]